MPLRWGARRSDVTELDFGVMDYYTPQEEVKPFNTFMDNVDDLRVQYKITGMEWMGTVFNTIASIEVNSYHSEFIIRGMLKELNESASIDMSMYKEYFDEFGINFLRWLSQKLEYYYPEYVEEDVPSFRGVWDSLNAAVASDYDKDGRYFKPVDYNDATINLTKALQESCIPSDILTFCNGVKELASKCKGTPLAQRVVEEADRILKV